VTSKIKEYHTDDLFTIELTKFTWCYLYLDSGTTPNYAKIQKNDKAHYLFIRYSMRGVKDEERKSTNDVYKLPAIRIIEFPWLYVGPTTGTLGTHATSR
jgi:hypothetical protein